MARAAKSAPQIINERDPGGDDDDDAPAGANGHDSIPGITNLRPAEVPSIRQQRPAKDETDYVIVETDAKGRPLNGKDQGEDEGDDLGVIGDETVVEQRRRAREMADRQDGDGGEGEDGPDANGNWPDHKSRRWKRREGKERMFAENKRMAAELEEVRGQLETFRSVVEPKLTEIDSARGREQLANLDNQIAAASAASAQAEKDVAAALREGDENAVIKAMRADKAAFLKEQQLLSAKQQLTARIQGGADGQRQPTGDEESRAQPQRRQAAPNPTIKARADDFLADHPWIQANKKPKDQDEDTRLALYLDEEVRREGFDPTTDDYWDELEERMRKRIPERFETPRRAANGNGAGAGRRQREATNDRREERRGPPVSGAGESRGAGGRREVRISPERRQAMIDQGTVAIDGTIIDQVKFKRTLKQYDDFDRANAR